MNPPPLGPSAPSACASPTQAGSLLTAGFLALGTFAIGTEGFMIAPLLPRMAADFGMSVPMVASLVVIFTLVLALSSPISTVLSAAMNPLFLCAPASPLSCVHSLHPHGSAPETC